MTCERWNEEALRILDDTEDVKEEPPDEGEAQWRDMPDWVRQAWDEAFGLPRGQR